MNISGIVVACRPEHVADVTSRLNALPWAQVHHTDPKGRLVVTIEASSTDESMDLLREVQAMPHVMMAEMAEYYVEDEPA